MNNNESPAPVLFTEEGVAYATTVCALLDTSHKPVGGEWQRSAAAMDIPVALMGAANCLHLDSVCPECHSSWASDYSFVEPVKGVDF